MGAEAFTIHGTGATAQEAFDEAYKSACYDFGHRGYTGSMAEKNDFVEIDLPEGRAAEEYAWHLMDTDDERISDKWGPAGCLKVTKGEYLFFGSASS